MSGRLGIPRTAAWVWHCGPRSIFGLDAVFVRCASGTSRGSDAFDYAANFKRWASARSPSVIPWTWLGPPASLDGLGAADLLCDIAPGRPLYVAELQFEIPGEEVVAFARRVRQREPDALLGFTSVPTRGRQLSKLASDENRPDRLPGQRTPSEDALLANRIIAIVQAHVDAGGRLEDDQLLTGVERALRDGTA